MISGLLREPKWGHLRDLHHALKLCSNALLWGTPSVQMFGHGLEVMEVTSSGSSMKLELVNHFCGEWSIGTSCRLGSTRSLVLIYARHFWATTSPELPWPLYSEAQSIFYHSIQSASSQIARLLSTTQKWWAKTAEKALYKWNEKAVLCFPYFPKFHDQINGKLTKWRTFSGQDNELFALLELSLTFYIIRL